MAYGVKYRHEFEDFKDHSFKLDILKDGYSGAITDIQGGGNPVTIHWLGEDNDIFSSPIIGSEAVIELTVQTSDIYSEFFTGSAREYMIKFYRAGSLLWSGWIDPYEYTEPYADPNYVIKIKAFDGIADMKTIKFPDQNEGTSTEWRQKLIILIAKILTLTDLDLDIHVASDIYFTMDDGVTEEYFGDIYADYRTFYDDGEFETCYEALDRILKPFSMRLYQSKGAWYLDRISYRISGTCTYKIYNSSGVYQSSIATQVNKTFTSTTAKNIVRPLNGVSVDFRPIYKEFTITQDMGKKRNILPANNFDGIFHPTEFVPDGAWIGYPIYWTTHGGLVMAYNTSEDGYISFEAGTAPPSYSRYAQSGKVEINRYSLSCSKMFIEAEMRLVTELNSSAGGSFVYMDIMLLETRGAVTNEICLSRLSASIGRFNQWTTLSDTCYYAPNVINLPDKVELFIRVFPAFDSTAPGSRTRFTHLRKATATWEFNMYTIMPEDVIYDRTIDYEIDSNNRYIPEETDLTLGDVAVLNEPLTPAINSLSRYSDLLYEKLFVDSNDVAIDDWYTAELPRVANKRSLVELILRNQITIHGRMRRQILSGDVFSDYIDYGSILEDYAGKRYLCNGVEVSYKTCRWNGEWVEIYDPGSPTDGDYDARDFGTADFWAI